ncbi:TRAP transporter substrate-binding protein DctP [Marinobacteraceae bacterium S3BR75-40.1]
MTATFRWMTGILMVMALVLTGCSKSSDGDEQAQSSSQSSENTSNQQASEGKTTTWRFALEEVDGSVQDAYATEFKKRVEEASGGKIKVEIYPYGSLGTSSQLTELVQSGALELAFASPGHLASVIPSVGVFTLHFVLSDDNKVNEKVLNSKAVHDILADPYHQQGLELMSIVPEGWMVWTANKPLRSPADFDGFKMRTMTSPILVESYKAYGANPTPKPYSQVYSGLQLGEIDGQVNPVFAIEEMSFYEEQDYMIFAKHAQFVSTFVAGQEWYNGLPEDQRKIVDKVTEELVPWIFEKQAEYNDQRLQKIEEAGGTKVIYLTDEERDKFRKASMKVRDTYIEQAGETGKKLLDTITSEVDKYEKEMKGEEESKDES